MEDPNADPTGRGRDRCPVAWIGDGPGLRVIARRHDCATHAPIPGLPWDPDDMPAGGWPWTVDP